MPGWGCISRRKRNLIPYFDEKHVICPIYWTDDVLLYLCNRKLKKGVDKICLLNYTLLDSLLYS